MKIAVFVDEYGAVLPLLSTGMVEVYSDESGVWKCANRIPLNMSDAGGMQGILNNIRMLVAGMAGCNLLVIERITGIARSYLNDFQIGVWLFNGFLLEESLLNHIRCEVEHSILEYKNAQETESGGEPEKQSCLDCSTDSCKIRDLFAPDMQKMSDN